jgi:hypothetical protein
MNRITPAAGNSPADVGGRIQGRVSGSVLLSIGLMTIGVCGAPTAVADAGTPVIRLCGAQLAVKPQHIVLTCGDGAWAIDNLVWQSWGPNGATGTGIEYQRTCVPNCATGSSTYSPATITLTGAAPPDFRYTSAVITDQNTGKSQTVGLG